MICRHCGMETGRWRSHATQQECIRSLRGRIEALEHEMAIHAEAAFHRDSNLAQLLQRKAEEVEELKDRLERMERVAGAVKKAMRRGTRKAWEELVAILERPQ